MFPTPLTNQNTGTYEFSAWFSRIKAYFANRDGFVTVTSDYTVPFGVYLVRVDATAGNVTVTLPSASDVYGREICMKKIDASGNSAILDGNGSETIDGAATSSVTSQYGTVTVKSVGTGWDKI